MRRRPSSADATGRGDGGDDPHGREGGGSAGRGLPVTRSARRAKPSEAVRELAAELVAVLVPTWDKGRDPVSGGGGGAR